jgi:hypothetical protein
MTDQELQRLEHNTLDELGALLTMRFIKSVMSGRISVPASAMVGSAATNRAQPLLRSLHGNT